MGSSSQEELIPGEHLRHGGVDYDPTDGIQAVVHKAYWSVFKFGADTVPTNETTVYKFYIRGVGLGHDVVGSLQVFAPVVEIPKINVTANKVWEGEPPTTPTIWFKLIINIEGEEPEAVPGTKVEVFINLMDSVTWRNVDKTDAEGNEYIFTVKEVNGDGEDWVSTGFEKVEEGLKVTNTFEIAKGDITVTKKWVVGPEEKPVVKLQLFRDGKEFGDVVELKGVATYTWKDLDITDATGKAYVYQVKEIDVPENYKVSYSEDGTEITNTWVEPEKPEEPKKPALPSTGAADMGWMLIAGLGLLGGGVVLNRKRK